MKNKIYNSRIFSLLFILFAFFANAQSSVEGAPEPPMTPTSGDIGGMIPPTSPIDNYIVMLLLVAAGIIVYFFKNKQLKRI